MERKKVIGILILVIMAFSVIASIIFRPSNVDDESSENGEQNELPYEILDNSLNVTLLGILEQQENWRFLFNLTIENRYTDTVEINVIYANLTGIRFVNESRESEDLSGNYTSLIVLHPNSSHIFQIETTNIGFDLEPVEAWMEFNIIIKDLADEITRKFHISEDEGTLLHN